jgi:membrane protein YdbS with pleckstrin-like domain
MEQLHPGARWLFRVSGWGMAIILSMFLGWFIFPLFFAIFALVPSIGGAILAFFLSFLVFIAFVIIFAEIYARLAYDNWQFEFTQESLRLERGIIWKRYSNVPYERIQNVDITRGIIARICGFSSVNIQTAGYSYSTRGMPISEGYIPAVGAQRAEQIREFVLKKIGNRNKQGL